MPSNKDEKFVVPKGAVKISEELENTLRDKEVVPAAVQEFFIDRPLKEPFSWTIVQINRQLRIGGKIYVAPGVQLGVRNVLETYHGKGIDRDGIIVYGEGSATVVENAKEPEDTTSNKEDTVEDLDSGSWSNV